MSYRILNCDVLDGLRQLPSECIQCCVTSPPYFNLRDFGTARWEGGDTSCDHLKPVGGLGKSTLAAKRTGSWGKCDPDKERAAQERQRTPYGKLCGKCGASRTDDQIGLEASPDAYVSKLVAVFREVRRVLRSDGSLWLNLGDSYGAGKQLTGIPWRVAFALQADGWYLRQDIIWHKPNPMPESVRDRCTKAHEYVFLLSKSPRYFFDGKSIKEPCLTSPQSREKNNGESAVDTKMRGHGNYCGTYMGGRNKRSVWTVTPTPYKGAHFATMPEKLVEPCVLVGSREGDTVIDPFAGSGTVGVVALRHNRQFIGIELNPAYVKLAEQRIEKSMPPLLRHHVA
jgi:DNA modification methylase